MKKRFAALMLLFSMLLSTVVLTGCDALDFATDLLDDVEERLNEPDPYIEGIRIAKQNDYGVTYGEAFDYFFTSPVWTSFVTDKGVYIVEFTGSCYFRNAPVNARIQFTILDDGQHFQATYLALNGTTQTEEMMGVLLADAFDAYLRSGK